MFVNGLEDRIRRILVGKCSTRLQPLIKPSPQETGNGKDQLQPEKKTDTAIIGNHPLTGSSARILNNANFHPT